jgi:hypothetical protein
MQHVHVQRLWNKILFYFLNWLRTLVLIEDFTLKIHLYFTSYKDKSKKVKIENHFKNNLIVYTYTKIKNHKKSKKKKIDENNFNL